MHISAPRVGELMRQRKKKGPIRCLVGPFVEEVGETVLAACVVLSDGSELRGEEVTRGGGTARAQLLPGVPGVVEDDGEAANVFGNATLMQDCALACKRKTSVQMSRPPGVVPG